MLLYISRVTVFKLEKEGGLNFRMKKKGRAGNEYL
jgi:hypothetical protein